MNSETILHDLIYLDTGKALSLLSQIEGGLLTEREEVLQDDTTLGADASIDVKFARLGGAGEKSKRKGIRSLSVVHHEMHSRIENWLFENGLACDFHGGVDHEWTDEHNGEIARERISKFSYIRVEGDATIDDYDSLRSLTEKFNSFLEFINKSAESTLSKNPDYQQITATLQEAERKAKQTKDRNQKSVLIRQVTELKGQVQAYSKVSEPLQDWLIEGLSLWLDEFLRHQIHLWIRPFKKSNIRVVSNLKREYFVDTDIEHLLFSYGKRPNVPLTVFGLITSIPQRIDDESNISEPNLESVDEESKNGKPQFETAFRKMFDSMYELEKILSVGSYPDIKIHPIAVYRTLHGKKDI